MAATGSEESHHRPYSISLNPAMQARLRLSAGRLQVWGDSEGGQGRRRSDITASAVDILERALAAELCGTPAAHCGIPHRPQKERPVQRVQMRQERGNLGKEWVVQDRRDLFVAAAARVANQLAHFHAKGQSQPFQRSQSGNRLAVFNFGDVSSRHLHSPRQLALAQMARPAHLAHLSGNLQAGSVVIRHRLAGAPIAAPKVPAPRYRGACGTFCKGNCWFYTASVCSTHTAPLRVYPRSLK